MITCNKCEQRSSVASDELFEKIVDEGSSSAAGTGEVKQSCLKMKFFTNRSNCENIMIRD
jgi:hypothetical protein